MDELRAYSMKLHTKQQAPREGQAEEPKNQGPVRLSLLHSLFIVEKYPTPLYQHTQTLNPKTHTQTHTVLLS